MDRLDRVVGSDVRRESSGVSPERGGSVVSLKAEYNRISSKGFGQCLCGGRQVVVAQWNRNSRKESAGQQCESQVQCRAGKKLGVSGVDGESWFGLEIARRFRPGRKPPTEADQTDRTGQPGAPARQGASANYDSWRGAAGTERKSSDFSAHPDFTFTFFDCSVSLCQKDLKLKCSLFNTLLSNQCVSPGRGLLRDLPATFLDARLFVHTSISGITRPHDKERLVANSNTPPQTRVRMASTLDSIGRPS